MKKNILKKIFGAGVAAGLLGLPLLVLAQGGVQGGLNNLRVLFPGSGIIGSTSLSGPNGLIFNIINALLLIVGAIAVLFVIIGGFWYVTSAGNEEQAEKGRTTVVNSIIGIVIVILSYVVINVIVNLVTYGF